MSGFVRRAFVSGACALVIAACGDDTTAPPLQIPFGQTTLVVLVNPIINEGNATAMPSPGTARSGVTVAVDEGPSGTTDANGIVVFGPVEPGTRTVALEGGGHAGEVTVTIVDKDIKELAVALDGSGAMPMMEVRYPFGGEVVEVTPSMSISEVNARLAQSNIIVFFRGGTYTGDLTFSGSNVTLFGEGERGGAVTIQGSVVVGGSSNRIRGARITGDLSVPGSGAGISFGHIDGSFDLSGSGAVLLNDGFCGSVAIAASNPTLLQNAGIAPLPKPASC